MAVTAPDWLRAQADKAWAERYERRGGDVHIPKGEAARRAFAETVGRDGKALLSAVTGPGAPAWLREVPAVEILRRVWVQKFCRLDDDAGPSEPDKPQVLRWRTEVEGYPPSALMVASPHDLDVHYAKKRQTTWIATCPAGQTSESWIPDTNCGHDNVRIRFSLTHCKACPLKARCTRSNRRVLAPRRRQEHETLVAARTVAKDPAFIAERKRRAGIEGTLSKALRTNGLRRSRYIGAAKTGSPTRMPS